MSNKCSKCGQLLGDHSYGLCPGSLSSVMSALGKRGAGKPKKFSEEELARRRAVMKKMNARRKEERG